MYSVCLLSKYMAAPTRQHLLATKRILRYLKGSMNFEIWYNRGEEKDSLLGYTDSDYAGDIDDRKSTSGYVFFFCRRDYFLGIKETASYNFINY